MKATSKASYRVLCPEGHGPLLELRGDARLFCPHQAHGGNGAFIPDSEAIDGPWDSRRAAAAVVEAAAAAEQDRPAPEPVALAPLARRIAARLTVAPPEVKGPRPCSCGCGEMTKGGKWRPGHDARRHRGIASAPAL